MSAYRYWVTISLIIIAVLLSRVFTLWTNDEELSEIIKDWKE